MCRLVGRKWENQIPSIPQKTDVTVYKASNFTRIVQKEVPATEAALQSTILMATLALSPVVVFVWRGSSGASEMLPANCLVMDLMILASTRVTRQFVTAQIAMPYSLRLSVSACPSVSMMHCRQVPSTMTLLAAIARTMLFGCNLLPLVLVILVIQMKTGSVYQAVLQR